MQALLSSTTSALLGGWTEVQLVLLVLSVMVIGVALLSYFVIAPEYEKHLEKQYAAIVQETNDNYTKSVQQQRTPRKKAQVDSSEDKRIEVEEMEAAFSDNENDGADAEPADPARRRTSNPDVYSDLSRRRMSESDALREASLNKAEMLRRRVLLRKLEEEIDGAIEETKSIIGGSATPRGKKNARLVRRGSLGFSDERLKQIQDHPVDCTSELEVLSSTQDADEVKQALLTVRDVLSYYLSADHRDMNKVTVFCNSLLKHDGLNHLRHLEGGASDPELRGLANQIIEKAVPAIWH